MILLEFAALLVALAPATGIVVIVPRAGTTTFPRRDTSDVIPMCAERAPPLLATTIGGYDRDDACYPSPRPRGSVSRYLRFRRIEIVSLFFFLFFSFSFWFLSRVSFTFC